MTEGIKSLLRIIDGVVTKISWCDHVCFQTMRVKECWATLFLFDVHLFILEWNSRADTANTAKIFLSGFSLLLITKEDY